MQWLLTFTELGTGALLILGLLSRGAAAGEVQELETEVLGEDDQRGRFAFEQPHEWVPPLILALVPAGLVWGLDGRLGHRIVGRLRPLIAGRDGTVRRSTGSPAATQQPLRALTR